MGTGQALALALLGFKTCLPLQATLVQRHDAEEDDRFRHGFWRKITVSERCTVNSVAN